jgi:16S rRNA A1518/A1519 N6-dimethyltransferase RsmA/KsgA/DIM1 with predicted DNA glycosylase/AP lyase activity
MVSFVRKEEKASRIKNIKLFTAGVNLFMQHRRKMLKACIKFIRRGGFAADSLTEIDDWSQIFEQCSVNPTYRPEQLSPEDYIAIANALEKRIT